MCKSNLHDKVPLEVCKFKVLSDDRWVFKRLVKHGLVIVTLELALTKCPQANSLIKIWTSIIFSTVIGSLNQNTI